MKSNRWRLGTAIVLLIIALVSFRFGITLLNRSLTDGHAGFLATGLLLFAPGIVALGLAVWLLLMVLLGAPSARATDRRTKAIVLAFAIPTAVLLLWLATMFVNKGHTGFAWLIGLLAFLSLLGTLCTVYAIESWTGSYILALMMLCQAALIWLAVDLAMDRLFVPAYLSGSFAILVAVFTAWIPHGSTPRWLLISWIFVSPAVTFGAVAFRLATDEHPILAGLVTSLTLILLIFILTELLPETSEPTEESLQLDYEPAGGAVSLLARLTGLAPSLLLLTVWQLPSIDWDNAVIACIALAWTGFVAAIISMFQHLVLKWLRPGPSASVMVRAAEHSWEIAAHRVARPDDWDSYRRHEHELAHYRTGVLTTGGPLRAVVRPLDTPGAAEVNLATTRKTGLIIDIIWPRIKLVTPPEVLREIDQPAKRVALLRCTVASAICATLALPLAALLYGRSILSASDFLLLATGPSTVALLTLVLARNQMTHAYQRRAEAVEIYRFDLVNEMHLPSPQTNAEFMSLAPILMGKKQVEYEGKYESASSGSVNDVRGVLQDFAEGITSQVMQQIDSVMRTERKRRERERIMVRLEDQQLAVLAEETARHAKEPLNDHLIRYLDTQQQVLDESIRRAIRSGIEESIHGPPLANFIGYLAIEIDRRQIEDLAIRVVDGKITARGRSRLNIVVSLVRDERARGRARAVEESDPQRPFYILEPITIEGGRDVAVAEFEIRVDSATLTPLPQLRNLYVAGEVQTSFGFQLPNGDSRHEVWLQLYQGGRLVQVTALIIEARSD